MFEDLKSTVIMELMKVNSPFKSASIYDGSRIKKTCLYYKIGLIFEGLISSTPVHERAKKAGSHRVGCVYCF